MTVVYDTRFSDSAYADDNASVSGRMEAAMSGFGKGGVPVKIIGAHPAVLEEILLAHEKAYAASITENTALFSMAALAAGGAILAAECAYKGEPTFACIRPPGHHASRESAWGHCTFNNLAIALLTLRERKCIENAFVLDIDAHTGDGTRTILKGWTEAEVFNPYADSAKEYLALVEQRLSEIQKTDILAVSAGFDAYIHDVGHKLDTDDYEKIGALVKNASRRLCKGRRFAVLEGGYFLPDLGKNVSAFCRGFSN